MLPIFFTLSINWLASAISFVWKTPVFQLIRNGLREGKGIISDLAGDLSQIDSPGRHAPGISTESMVRAKEFFMSWLWGASSVVLNPFFTLVATLAASLVIYAAARVLIDSDRPIRFRSILRIVCFAGTPILWSIIPIVGALVAPIAVVATTSIALVEVYKIGYKKAVFIAMLPKLMILISALGGLIAFGLIAFRLIAANFGFS